MIKIINLGETTRFRTIFLKYRMDNFSNYINRGVI